MKDKPGKTYEEWLQNNLTSLEAVVNFLNDFDSEEEVGLYEAHKALKSAVRQVIKVNKNLIRVPKRVFSDRNKVSKK